MDFRKLAADITVFLTPFFPYLILAGEITAKEIGKKFGEAAWEKAKFLWDKIQTTSQDDPKLKGVATALAEDPDDKDFQVAFAKLLTKQLEVSPELANQLINSLKGDKAVQKILIEQRSRVKDVHQRLSKIGKQEITIRDSQSGDITQEQ